MLFEPGHPVVERSYWDCFSNNLNPYFSYAIGREQLDLPYWLTPVAWGVIVPSPLLLQRTKYDGLLDGWKQQSSDVYHREIDKTRLRVRRTNGGRLWLISRWSPGIPMRTDRKSETLAHDFGPTPLVAVNLLEALHLAHWFQTNDPIGGLRWVKATPKDLVGAIEFADQRAKSMGVSISWNDLWASSAHSRRMKSGQARYRKGKLLPPVIVRVAFGKTTLH